MNIREKENELFKDYVVTDETKTQKDIVPDGVIDEASFLKAEKKILFLLKEVNGGDGWDLRNFVNKNCREDDNDNKPRIQTWDNVYRWTRAILESNSICWKDVENVEREQHREEILKKIAVMNVKKTSGGSSADGTELKKATKANKEVLRKQIELYDADYIVCGYTHEYFDMLDYLTEEDKKTKGYVYFPEAVGDRKDLYSSYFIKKDKKQAIVYVYHPQSYINHQDLFDVLLKTVKEIEEKLENVK
ncbi:MAG: hypothetical protein Q4A47_01385 [Erysipelotrichaceae bacterium]|nr:hypothetical protein [Erysipelotrichaceae bacterium]